MPKDWLTRSDPCRAQRGEQSRSVLIPNDPSFKNPQNLQSQVEEHAENAACGGRFRGLGFRGAIYVGLRG